MRSISTKTSPLPKKPPDTMAGDTAMTRPATSATRLLSALGRTSPCAVTRMRTVCLEAGIVRTATGCNAWDIGCVLGPIAAISRASATPPTRTAMDPRLRRIMDMERFQLLYVWVRPV